MAPEGLREIRGLAIADPHSHLAHGRPPAAKKLDSAAHPDIREITAEGRPADLGEGALQLAPRGEDASRQQLDVEVTIVLGLDDRHGLPEDRPAAPDRGPSLRHASRLAAP